MKIDTEKLSKLIQSELKEIEGSFYDSSTVCLGEVELLSGVKCQVLLTFSVDEEDFIDKPNEEFICITS